MSDRLTPTNWQTQEAIYKKLGFVLERESSSHRVYSKKGVVRPLVLPKYDEVGLNIITGNMRTAGISRKEYLKILKKL